MNLSTRLLPRFGLSLIAVVAVACAQPGAGDGDSPSAPSSLPGGSSATAAGPSAGYDASGTWCIANTDADGNLEGDPFETVIS